MKIPEKIKIKFLNWLFNPALRVLLLFLTITNFVYYYGIYIQPENILGYIGLIIITYVVLIIGVECIGEVVLNSELNEKQIKFLEGSSAVLLIPLSAYLIYNLFVIKEFSILVITWGIVSSYLILFAVIKSLRWSFVITWILATLFFIKMQISSPIIFWSLGLSHFFLLLFIRYSEINPFLWVNSSREENLKKLKESLLSKTKENMIKSEGFAFVSKEPLFIKENEIYDEFESKIKDNQKIEEVKRLIKVKKLLDEFKFNRYIETIPLLKKMDIPINKRKIYDLNLAFKSLKFIDYILMCLFVIFFFNPKANRRISRLIFDNYESLNIVGPDNKELWKSDMDLDILGREEQIFLFETDRIIAYFQEAPSLEFLTGLQEAINGYKLKQKNHKKIINKRIDYATKAYGEKSPYLNSYIRLKKGLLRIEKQIKVIEKDINISSPNKP